MMRCCGWKGHQRGRWRRRWRRGGVGRKKDWGEARPSPYWVESCPAVACVALASVFRRRITGRERAPVDSVGGEQVHDVALSQCVAVVSGPGWRRRGLSPCVVTKSDNIEAATEGD
jgi:hypothetical protein